MATCHSHSPEKKGQILSLFAFKSPPPRPALLSAAQLQSDFYCRSLIFLHLFLQILRAHAFFGTQSGFQTQHTPDVYENQRCPKSRLWVSCDNPSLTRCFLLECSLGLPPKAESFLNAGCTSKVPRAPLNRLHLCHDSTSHTLLILSTFMSMCSLFS